jgi:hypothetical protein
MSFRCEKFPIPILFDFNDKSISTLIEARQLTSHLTHPASLYHSLYYNFTKYFRQVIYCKTVIFTVTLKTILSISVKAVDFKAV